MRDEHSFRTACAAAAAAAIDGLGVVLVRQRSSAAARTRDDDAHRERRPASRSPISRSGRQPQPSCAQRELATAGGSTTSRYGPSGEVGDRLQHDDAGVTERVVTRIDRPSEPMATTMKTTRRGRRPTIAPSAASTVGTAWNDQAARSSARAAKAPKSSCSARISVSSPREASALLRACARDAEREREAVGERLAAVRERRAHDLHQKRVGRAR